jgi:hypothetical protein
MLTGFPRRRTISAARDNSRICVAGRMLADEFYFFTTSA